MGNAESKVQLDTLDIGQDTKEKKSWEKCEEHILAMERQRDQAHTRSGTPAWPGAYSQWNSSVTRHILAVELQRDQAHTRSGTPVWPGTYSQWNANVTRVWNQDFLIFTQTLYLLRYPAIPLFYLCSKTVQAMLCWGQYKYTYCVGSHMF